MIDKVKAEMQGRKLLLSQIYIDIYSILQSSLAFSRQTDPTLQMHTQNRIYNRSLLVTGHLTKIAVYVIKRCSCKTSPYEQKHCACDMVITTYQHA